ncbi:MAG: exodeoxyribonuclease III [Syntrophotaleaceae bacterium]
MKIVSFNINGIRARLHQLQSIIERHRPDIIGLQEIKVQDGDFPIAAIRGMGYQVHFHGQKSHYGVALLSKSEPLAVDKGFPEDGPEDQRRLIAADYPLPDGTRLRVVNGYFPQGESRGHPVKFPAKKRFFENLHALLHQKFHPEDKLVLMGDANVAPDDLDVGIGEDNILRWLRSGKCSFLPEERDWLKKLQDWGLVDTFRLRYPTICDRFSWFDYRSRGFEREPRRGLRIDLLLATDSLAVCCSDSGIDYDIRAMERPSDHCPVWAEFDLPIRLSF